MATILSLADDSYRRNWLDWIRSYFKWKFVRV